MTLSELSGMVRKAREQKGMSHDELAMAAGVAPKFVEKLEDGESTAQVSRALQVFQALGISVTLQQSKGD